MTKYEWTLNGTVVGTTEAYEIPGSVKDGDEIKVTVTDELGNKASDTVYVGGLTILYVEPTTAGATNKAGFKYIRASFSSALTELAPSQVEIRRKSDNQLYSVESVVLSADGKFADITLFGDSSAAGTVFLQANEIYTMKVTQGVYTASLDFELPAYNTEAVVTSVNMSKNKIYVVDSGKTQKDVKEGTYNVANKYDGNLGALVGRAITFGYDSDQNMTSFSLLDQQVVYGYMKGFVPNANNENTWYYKDALSGEKYYCKADTDKTASVRGTLWIRADGDETDTTYDYMIADNTEYAYTKLVLNSDGTIATATVEKNLPNTLYVKSVDGTIVTQDVNNAFDLKDYIIVRDGDFIATSDLEEGDIIFLNPSKKFAEVYVSAVSGEISDVIDGKLSIDGKAYEWYEAQYWDDANDKFVRLASKGDTVGIQNSQNYLNSLSTDVDTFIYLGRDGKIKYLEGTPIEEVVTTTRELIIGTAKGYEQSLDKHLRVPAFDGEANDTIDVVDSSLKTMFGDKGTVTETVDAGDPENSKIAFVDKDDDAPKTDYDFTATEVGNAVQTEAAKKVVVFPNTYLVDVVRNEAGSVTGFKPLNATQPDGTKLTYTPVYIAKIDGKAFDSATASDITADTKKITTSNGKTLSLGSYTNIWYHYTKDDGTITGSKWALNEFPSAAVHDYANHYLVYSDGTKATDIVVIGTETKNLVNEKWGPTIKTGDTTTYSGIIVGNTKKNDSEGKNKVNTVKMILTDGSNETFDVAEDASIFTWVDTNHDGNIDDAEKTAWAIENNKFFATATVRTTDDKVTQIVVDMNAGANGWTDNTDYLPATRNKVSSKLETADDVELTVTNSAALLLKYTEEGSTKFKTVTYSEVNTTETKMNVWYHTNYTDVAGKVEADMIVVEDTGKKDVGEITLNAITANITADGLVGTATLNDENATFALIEMVSGNTVDTLTYYNGNLYSDNGCDFAAGKSYRIIGSPSDTTKFVWSGSNVETTGTATATSLSVVYGGSVEKLSTNATSDYHTATLLVLDQFGDAATTYTLANSTPAKATVTTTGTGEETITAVAAGTTAIAITGVTGSAVTITVEAPEITTAGTYTTTGHLVGTTNAAVTVTFSLDSPFLDQFGDTYAIDTTAGAVDATAAGSGATATITVDSMNASSIAIKTTDDGGLVTGGKYKFDTADVTFTLTIGTATQSDTLTAVKKTV